MCSCSCVYVYTGMYIRKLRLMICVKGWVVYACVCVCLCVCICTTYTPISCVVNGFQKILSFFTLLWTWCLHSCTHINMHTYIHAYMHTYTILVSLCYMEIHTYWILWLQTYKHTYIHTYIHTALIICSLMAFESFVTLLWMCAVR